MTCSERVAFVSPDMNKKSTSNAQRGAPKKKVTKRRRNISLTPIEDRMAEAMAFSDGRSVSDFLGRLIKEKHEAFKARKGASA